MFVVLLIGILFSSLGCSDSVSPEKDNYIYLNTFESDLDFEGWAGIGEHSWKTDTPPNGGDKSVLVSGGCPVPHSRYTIQYNLSPGYYIIECWGKTFDNSIGGGVILKYYNTTSFNDSSVFIQITDSIWTHKISDTLYIANLDSIVIEMNSGGFAAAGMLIDNLGVKKIY